MSIDDTPLTVAVTGPTGTFGHGFLPMLQADDRIARIVGIARRPFAPEVDGWTKMTYRQGDVRRPDDLLEAFAGADVVVHLAFAVTGAGPAEQIRAINLEGTRNAFAAAVAVGARRFVYPSSVAAYGFHRDNPVGLTDDWPVRPAERLFYAQQNAQLERALAEASEQHPEIDLYVLRPSIVVGPHTLGAKVRLPSLPLPGPLRAVSARLGRIRLPVPAPTHPVQFVHHDDVGQALLLSTVGAGPPGAYNITGDGVVTVADVVRAAGLLPVPVPGAVSRVSSRALAKIPPPSFLPPVLGWIEAGSHPAIMDNTKAVQQLGWRPRYDSRGALDAAFAR